MKATREYLIAISIDRGLITLINEIGEIGVYRQKGLGKCSVSQLERLVLKGNLDPHAMKYPELPKNWSISYEDEEIMGRASATFPKSLIDKCYK